MRCGRNLERTGLGEAKAVQIASLENKEGEADSLLEQIVNSSGASPSVITFFSFFKLHPHMIYCLIDSENTTLPAHTVAHFFFLGF
jgi:hypothetical protein